MRNYETATAVVVVVAEKGEISDLKKLKIVG